MSTVVREVNWSDLSRDPTKVAELADAGDVRVIRRDHANLLLIREDRAAASEVGAVSAARALRSLLDQMSPAGFAEGLREEFPWMRYLSANDTISFGRDFADGAMAAAELGQWRLLGQIVHEWKASALIYSDPALARELSRPLTEDYGLVPSPISRDEAEAQAG